MSVVCASPKYVAHVTAHGLVTKLLAVLAGAAHLLAPLQPKDPLNAFRRFGASASYDGLVVFGRVYSSSVDS